MGDGIDLVCASCAHDAGGACLHDVNWWVDECDVCGRVTAVTTPNEIGNPKFGIEDEDA